MGKGKASREQVLCVSTGLFKKQWNGGKQAYTLSETTILEQLSRCNPAFIPRAEAEQDRSYKQLIPYCLVKNRSGLFLCYERRGTEERLHGLRSLGIGGHINPGDKPSNGQELLGTSTILKETIHRALRREVAEEIGVSVFPEAYTCLGLIQEEESAVGLVHVGVVYLLTIDTEGILGGEEIGDYEWLEARVIHHHLSENREKLPPLLQKRSTEPSTGGWSFERWSELAFRLVPEAT
ncbi:MAG: NUDIX domain-containing protein [Treponemataceae bacterium]|nr:NUDIX domain-containing protein [Treponemataceae bacterium]